MPVPEQYCNYINVDSTARWDITAWEFNYNCWGCEHGIPTVAQDPTPEPGHDDH